MTSCAPASPVDAIFFGAAGTLANTSDLHYSAYNQALKEAKLPVWDETHYRKTLRNDNGGVKRVKAFLQEQGLAVTEEQCVAIHERKTEIFVHAVKDAGGLKPRPGVLSLLKDAKAQGLKTALCSTAHRSNVDLMFEEVEGLSRDLFDMVISGGDAAIYGENKPSPDVYAYAMESLNVTRPVAIEDAQMSVQAPVNAGIPCVAVPGFWCKDHDFSAAIARLEDLPEGASVKDMAALVVPKSALTTNYGKENSQGAFWVDDGVFEVDYSAALARLEDLAESASVKDLAGLVVPKPAATKSFPTWGASSHYGKENSPPAFEFDDKLMGA